MRSRPILLEFLAHAFRDQMHRQTRRVGSHNRAGLPELRDTREQIPLNFQILCHHLNNPVGAVVKKAAGFDFFAASSPARTILLRSAASPALNPGGTISRSSTGTPAFAKCAAIRAPMVPAPNTTAFSIRLFMNWLKDSPLYRACTDGQVTKPTYTGQSN
jgi:hypothetical protein